MALTESTMLQLGAVAPEFSLTTGAGNVVSKNGFADQPLLVMFICNHCPYVKHLAPELARLGSEYQSQGLGIVAIQSNDVSEYPDDSPEMMNRESAQRGYTFPYVFDETQQVAHAFTAACTPDFFLFDRNHCLIYRGRLDDTRPKRIRSGVYDSTENPPNGLELRAAIELALRGESPSTQQLPSIGCNIKWKPGNEPSYF